MGIKEFVEYLKNHPVIHLVCEKCGYSQGHPIIYCPKCPGKMLRKIETQYDVFVRDNKIHNSSYYKFLYIQENEYISQEEWEEIVAVIKYAAGEMVSKSPPK